MENKVGEPHPGLCSSRGAWLSMAQQVRRKARLARRKRLGGLLVLPRHLFVSLPASQPSVPPGRMTAFKPLNQSKLSLNFGNIRRHVQGRNDCIARESGARQTPPTAPTPCCLTQPPHPIRPPSPSSKPRFFPSPFFSISNFN